MERDWAFIVKREYNFDCLLKPLGYGFAFGNVCWTAGIFLTKRMVWWPLLVGSVAGFLYCQPLYFQIHNKKFFDMCNVGEQYYLGTLT